MNSDMNHQRQVAINLYREQNREPAFLTSQMVSVLEGLQESICVVDANALVVYCNDSMRRFFLRRSTTEFGYPLFDVFSGECRAQLERQFRVCRQQRLPIEGICIPGLRAHETTIYRYKMKWLPAKDGDGFVMFSFSPYRNTGDAKNEAVPDTALRAIGDLTLKVMQELAGPLNEVCHYVEQIADLFGEKRPPMLDRQLNGIVNQIHRIASLAHNLVSLSNQFEPTYVNLSLNEILLDAIENYEVEQRRKLKANLYLDDELPQIIGDPFVLTSVLHHLLRVVDELAGEDAVPRILTRTHPQNHSVLLEMETRKTAPGNTQSGTGGVGQRPEWTLSPGARLGLHIAERLLVAQYGRLEQRAERSRGCVFTLSLACYQPAAEIQRREQLG